MDIDNWKKMLFGIIKKYAFTLLEFIVYLALFSFISMLFLGIFSRTQLKFIKNSYEQEILLREVIAVDILRRDLISASNSAFDWIIEKGVFKKTTLTKNNHQRELSVCWFIGKNGLKRAQGIYNFEKQIWDEKTDCLVCNSIKQINFIPVRSDSEGFYAGFWVVYKSVGSDQEKKIFVKFRNRFVM